MPQSKKWCSDSTLKYKNSDIANIYLTYAIYGGFYAMREDMESNSNRVINVVGQITEKSSEVLLK